jgi:hypothetical protein
VEGFELGFEMVLEIEAELEAVVELEVTFVDGTNAVAPTRNFDVGALVSEGVDTPSVIV